MKLPHLSLLSLLTFATCTGCILVVDSPDTGATNMKGNCGELTCEELLAQLRSNWQKEVIKYESKCQEKHTLGLNVFEQDGIEKVSLICWNEPDETGTVYGDWLGVFPFPGNEENFASPWKCDGSPECDEILSKLPENNPEIARKYEIECAIKQGELVLLIPETEETKEAEVQCQFFVPSTQIDDNGDGISDGEMAKPTGVNIILGKVNL